MTLREIYHVIRPMAALRAGEKTRVPSFVWFLAAALVSVVGGVASGCAAWSAAGFSPDNSGGTLILILGSCFLSLLAVVIALFWKNRAVFYGLNVFTLLTVGWLVLSIISSLIA
jgi:hypothetical protein